MSSFNSSTMESETVTLSEISSATGGRGGRLFLEARLKNEGKEGFVLKVLDGDSVWEGTISEDDLDEQCAKLKMDFDTYVKETKAAFTQENVSDQSFECDFKSTAAAGQLSWKKMPVADVKYHLGSVTLKKCPTSAAKVCEILNRCIARTHALQAQVQSLESDNERLSVERQNALKRLDKCVTAKEQLEKDLYSKFVLVLNSKKERIKDLEERLQSVESGQETAAPTSQASSAVQENSVPSTSRKTTRGRNGQTSRQMSDSQSEDYDVDTEEESSSAKKSKMAALSQNSRAEESFLKLSEDEEEEPKLAPVARRPQRQKATKKQTPAKPILPRVSSGDAQKRPGSAGKRSSLRQSASGESGKSSDNLDPDDLINNF